MAKRAYGSGRLFLERDKLGRETWYGSWWAGGRRVKRRIGARRAPGGRDGLTRVQAERELRRRMEHDLVLARAAPRLTVTEAADRYIEHLEHVMERKRTTIQDYRGYVRRHLAPHFADRPLDRIDAARVTGYLNAKRAEGLSSKTIQNHLNFLHGVFAFAVKRGWAPGNPVAQIDRPKKTRSAQRPAPSAVPAGRRGRPAHRRRARRRAGSARATAVPRRRHDRTAPR